MADLATLDIAIDSRRAVTAAADLGRLETAARGAEQSTDRLRQSSDRGVTATQRAAAAQAAAAQAAAREAAIREAAARRQLAAEEAARQAAAVAARAAEQAARAAEQAARRQSAAQGDLQRSAGLAAHQLGNLRSQAIDVASSLSGGAGAIQVFSQQAGQIYEALAGAEGGVNGALRDLAGRFATFATSGVGAFTAVAAAGALATYAVAQQVSAYSDLRKSLLGVGQGTGVTADRLNEVAAASAKASNVSVSAAQAMAAEFARTGAIGAENISRLIGVTKNFSIVAGQDMAEATKTLATAMKDPVKGLVDLNEKTGAFDARTQQLVATLIASGDRLKAQQVLIDGVARASKNATDALGPFEKIWDRFKTGISTGISQAGQDIPRWLGFTSTQDQLTAATKKRDDLQSGLTTGFSLNAEFRRQELAAAEALVQKLYDQLDIEDKIAAALGKQKEEREQSLRAAALIASQNPALGQQLALTGNATTLRQGLESGRLTPDQSEAATRQLAGTQDLLRAYGENATAAQRASRALWTEFEIGQKSVFAYTDAQRAASAALKAYSETLNQTRDPVAALAAAEQARIGVLNQSKAAVEEMLRSTEREQAYVQAEIDSLGMSTRARSEYLAGIRAENELKAQGRDIRDEASQRYIREQEELARLKAVLEAETAATERSSAAKAANAAARQATAAAAEAETAAYFAASDKAGYSPIGSNWNDSKSSGGSMNISGVNANDVKRAQELYGSQGTWDQSASYGGVYGTTLTAHAVFRPNEAGLKYYQEHYGSGATSGSTQTSGLTSGGTAGGAIQTSGLTSGGTSLTAMRQAALANPATAGQNYYYQDASGQVHFFDTMLEAQQGANASVGLPINSYIGGAAGSAGSTSALSSAAAAGTAGDMLNAMNIAPKPDAYALRNASIYYGSESGNYYGETSWAETMQSAIQEAQTQTGLLQSIADGVDRMATAMTAPALSGAPAVPATRGVLSSQTQAVQNRLGSTGMMGA